MPYRAKGNFLFHDLEEIPIILFQSEEAVLFEDRIDSDAIDLVYGPMLDIQSHADYIFVNESIILPLTFRAKPVPSIEGITWQILNGDVIQIMQGGDVTPTTNVDRNASDILFAN